MATDTEIRVLGEVLSDVNRQAQQDVVNLWRTVQAQNDPEFIRDAIVQVLPEITNQYGQLSGVAAATWYDGLDSDSSFRASPAGVVGADTIRGSALYAARPLFIRSASTVLSRMGGLVQRHVYEPARMTVVEASEAEGVAWGRVTHADGCAFCRMLASRGFVYGSQELAGGGNQWHDHCRCTVTPRRGRDADNIPGYEQFLDQYRTATGEVGGTDTTEVLAAMRAAAGTK